VHRTQRHVFFVGDASWQAIELLSGKFSHSLKILVPNRLGRLAVAVAQFLDPEGHVVRAGHLRIPRIGDHRAKKNVPQP
jgi:hypothetical protein